MKHVSVHTFKEVVAAEKGNDSVDFINVCTPVEYAEKHIEGVRNMPLDTLEQHVAELNKKTTVYVHCRSGNRSKQAIEKLEQLGVTASLVNVEGGLLAWGDAGFATRVLSNRLPLMRQVFIAAGLLVVLGYVLSVAVAPLFIAVSVGVGIGLIFAGVSGWCGMSYLLAKMPWNTR